MSKVPIALIAYLAATQSHAAEIVDVQPVTENLIMVHWDEGQVIHHTAGQIHNDDRVVISPLDTVGARSRFSYLFGTAGLPGVPVDNVFQKSKGTEFAWYVDRWENGRAYNDRPDHTKEHWFFLTVPPMVAGVTYELDTGDLALNGRKWTFTFDPRLHRSEAVHVNTVGYSSVAPQKFGYVYAWLGDGGPLNLDDYLGRDFRVIDMTTGETRVLGRLALRKRKDTTETAWVNEAPPFGNFQGADVFECDFSSLTEPGTYRLAVDGIGGSYPFTVSADPYRDVFYHVARTLYHNRSGIALQQPFTEFVRPAPHNPLRTPGFRGKLKYVSKKFSEWGSEGGEQSILEPAIVGDLVTSGWYQDAGDWDSYPSHLRVAIELMMAYEVRPSNFWDGQLNLPESGNGIPDILDEAAWLPRFCVRLRRELLDRGYGTGGIGLRIAGDAFGTDGVGVSSYQDVNRIWVVSAEEANSTYGYAGVAANLARIFKKVRGRDPQRINWAREAVQAYAWAKQNEAPGEEAETLNYRRYAAASLFALTGDKTYEADFLDSVSEVETWEILGAEDGYGAFLYAMHGGEAGAEGNALARWKEQALYSADVIAQWGEDRALRWSGNFWMPMLVGQQTTPMVLQLPVGIYLAERSDPARAQRYWQAMYNTADYFMGTNATHQTWVSGFGARPVRRMFRLDSWYHPGGQMKGMIPYGPWRKQQDFGEGPWSQFWAYQTAYPSTIEQWPAAEQWFHNSCAPMSSEFTIHQQSGPAAAFYGLLMRPSDP